jgi:hypothetical protein
LYEPNRDQPNVLFQFIENSSARSGASLSHHGQQGVAPAWLVGQAAALAPRKRVGTTGRHATVHVGVRPRRASGSDKVQEAAPSGYGRKILHFTFYIILRVNFT